MSLVHNLHLARNQAKSYDSIEAVQKDLYSRLLGFDTERSHQGPAMKEKTPADDFIQGLPQHSAKGELDEKDRLSQTSAERGNRQGIARSVHPTSSDTRPAARLELYRPK